jgi:alkylation response protein AidB-like acyl-CoA dehydrogenase
LTELDILLSTLREFVNKEIEPLAERIDRNDEYPRELVRKMGQMGYLSPLINGLSHYEMASIVTEIAKASGSVALIQDAQGELVIETLRYSSNKKIYDEYIYPLSEGRLIGGFGLSEPCCGSDAASIKTRAVRKGNRWIIDGKKMWTTQGTVADIFVIVARTGREEEREKGLSIFIVPKDKCIEVRKIEVMGCRGTGTAEITLNECEINDDEIIGEVNKGWNIIKHVLNVGRIAISALALGLSIGAFEEALEWARNREAFGRKIFEFQGIRWYFAESLTHLEILKTYLKEVTHEYDKFGDEITHKISILKLYSARIAQEVIDKAVQVMGGMGYAKGSKTERAYRDIRLTRIGEGTDEVQLHIISKYLENSNLSFLL